MNTDFKYYPSSLPRALQSGYVTRHKPNILRTQMADGYTRQRLINQGAPDIVNVNICLNEKQIDHLAQELTNHLNNIIKGIISNFKNIKNFGSIIDINKIIKENKTNNDKRYKIVVRYNHENYYFFINNNTEDINDMTNIIINNIIKKEKYDSSALREEIIKKINNSFDKKDNKDHINSGIKY